MRFITCRPQSSEALYRFFDDDFLAQLSGKQQFPVALDVVEDKDQYVLKADLPGINKEDIKVSLENGILTIEGERKSETEQKDKQVHRVERSYKDGVLQLNVPKAQAAKPKSIDVHVD